MQTMPKPQKAPEWIKFPKLVMEKCFKIRISVEFDIQEQDCSDIIWKRETNVTDFLATVTENRADSIDW